MKPERDKTFVKQFSKKSNAKKNDGGFKLKDFKLCLHNKVWITCSLKMYLFQENFLFYILYGEGIHYFFFYNTYSIACTY